MRGSVVGWLAVSVLGGCAPYSMTSGGLGSNLTPNEFKTQYAWWDSHVYVKDDDDRWVLKERSSADAGPEVFYMEMYGFSFNPTKDRRTWNANDWMRYQTGVATEPYFTLQVVNADLLKDGDEVEYVFEAPRDGGYAADAGASSERRPRLVIGYSPGKGALTQASEYPEKVDVYGSNVRAKLTFGSALSKEAGMGRSQGGTLEYAREKSDGDPSDAVEGDIKVQFSALVLGERLAECNEGIAAGGTAYYDRVSACQQLNAEE